MKIANKVFVDLLREKIALYHLSIEVDYYIRQADKALRPYIDSRREHVSKDKRANDEN